MAATEFQIIDRYFAARGVRRGDVALGIGDDAALLEIPEGMQLVAAVDGLTEGVHFPHGTDPAAVGYKALAVNLSDLAAMGAEPAWATLFLSMPDGDETRARDFADGFFGLADRVGLDLVGGDTVRGPFTAVVQVMGLVPRGEALRRDGARPGDGIYVTGSLGEGGAGLAVVQGRLNCEARDAEVLRKRLDRPEPRLAAGRGLRGIASAAIDISDGLAADLGHILERSATGAAIELARLPFSEALTRAVPEESARIGLALAGGDDYELCFTVPAAHEDALVSASATLGCPITRIGRIEAAPGLRWLGADGRPWSVDSSSFDHFAGGTVWNPK